ncbi:MAG: radical SAM protein [Candidatus Woesearchaeota archaeon]|nr:radical SAM protein [Candidatus Woesearchaeota archaeon]MDP7457112.1 radical SAM protein [Candidatus Woesearchaeota archaeon]
MKILFVRPPRTFWPFNSESSSFWQPLAFCSLAAVLRERLDVSVKILDCLPLKIGWKSLRKHIEKENPDIIALGDETASSHEGIKVVNLVKEIDPSIKVVGGGYFFGNMIEDSLKAYDMDFIIMKEGEMTMLDLVRELEKPVREQDFSKIKGLAYKDREGRIVINPIREFIKNLDELPLPAYDLLPMELYGVASKNHKDFVAIEHGRGCTASCNFCSIFSQMSPDQNPLYRTKSAERCLEETELLIKKFKRKTFNWVDGTWNASPTWLKEYCDGVVERGWDIQHTAWMRADYVLRDEKLGLLKKQVDAGLVECVIGAERPKGFDQDLNKLNKLNYSFSKCNQAFKVLKKYDKVYTIASFIYGLPEDDKNVLKSLNKVVHSDFADMVFLLPFTPNPGTPTWLEHRHKFPSKDFRKHNYHFPVMDTKYLSKEELQQWFKKVLFWYVFWPDRLLKRICFEKDERKKRLHKSLAQKILFASGTKLLNMVTFNTAHEDTFGRCPVWYYC